MKVLHVINSLIGSGGAEQGLVREITHFDPSVESLVVRLFEANDLEPVLTSRGIKVLPLGLSASESAWTWPEAARRLRGHIRVFQPDIIQTTLFAGNLVGQLAAGRTGIPVLSTLTLTGNEQLQRELQPGAKTRRAAFLRRVAAKVGRQNHIWYRALSEDTASTNGVSMGLDPTRIVVIPRGVPFVDAVPNRARFGVPEGVPLIVNVGRQAAQKGQLLLLQTFLRMKETLPTAHLSIAGGEGDATPALRKEVRALGLESSVHLLGYRDDVATLLASADLFIFTSLAEGLGTAVIEAMVAGLPVVAFDIPPIREATGGGRFARLVPTGDVEQMSAEALRIVTGKSVLSGNRQAWVLHRYSLPRVAEDVQSLLIRVAALSKEARLS